MSDHSENLSDFRMTVKDVVERAGRPIYMITVLVDRGSAIEVVGFLDLLPDEWARLRAAISAHGGGGGAAPGT